MKNKVWYIVMFSSLVIAFIMLSECENIFLAFIPLFVSVICMGVLFADSAIDTIRKIAKYSDDDNDDEDDE